MVHVWSMSGGATIPPNRESGGRVGVDVDGVGVGERGGPVADHRLVHRIGGDGRPAPADRLADQRLQLLLQCLVAHVALPFPTVTTVRSSARTLP